MTAVHQPYVFCSKATSIKVVMTKDITDNDVLCGRGEDVYCHSGNESFRRLVNEKRTVYLRARFKREKRVLAESIVQSIHDLQPRGRFLKKVLPQGKKRRRRNAEAQDLGWIEISNDKAREKASQALRENAPARKKELMIVQSAPDVPCQAPVSSKQPNEGTTKGRLVSPSSVKSMPDVCSEVQDDSGIEKPRLPVLSNLQRSYNSPTKEEPSVPISFAPPEAGTRVGEDSRKVGLPSASVRSNTRRNRRRSSTELTAQEISLLQELAFLHDEDRARNKRPKYSVQESRRRCLDENMSPLPFSASKVAILGQRSLAATENLGKLEQGSLSKKTYECSSVKEVNAACPRGLSISPISNRDNPGKVSLAYGAQALSPWPLDACTTGVNSSKTNWTDLCDYLNLDLKED